MAEGQLTIGIPGAGATDFAVSPIPSLVIQEWPEQLPVRSPVFAKQLAGFSLYGTGRIEGPAHAIKYTWEVAAYLNAADARKLFRLFAWQQVNKSALRLIDEVELLDVPDERTVLATLTEAYGSGLTYGFGVYGIWLQLAENWRSHAGAFSDSYAKLVTFTMTEIG
jgi:hypothetical protein